MKDLLERVRFRLAAGSYANEAAVSHGVVTPILNALGWDSSDPDQLVPEFSIGRGRVDFALLGLGRRPSVFIEVKGVGRAVDGDRQLFEYAFHEGVPLCVLTDGRDWSFYLPSGQGSYEDRRVYRLQLDDREPAESESVLQRYLGRERVRSGAAFEDAQRDYRDAAGRREAATALPRAWSELLTEREELLLELVADKAEGICGFRPMPADVFNFLAGLAAGPSTMPLARPSRASAAPPSFIESRAQAEPPIPLASPAPMTTTKAISYRLFGKEHVAASANVALVQVLEALAATDPVKIPELAGRVQGRSRNHIARSPEEIYPSRPDLARAAEFHPGWLVGLNIANREKMGIIRSACLVYGLTLPGDLDISLPNAN
ncbi:hypothetical protein [Sphingomonas sp.]|uniref:hypothetical protein n=1 Tax=Sphingomonas sp. TaxID=28214 RepID=UPI003AFFAEC0